MSVAKVVHAENARLSKNRVFAPYPEATHLVRLDDAEDAVRRVAAAATAAERERTRRALAEPRAYRLALAEYAARRERGEDRFESMRLAIGLLAADLIEKGDTDA